MDTNDPVARAESQALLRYAQVTYAAVTEQRRRVALAFLSVAVVFGLIAAFGGVKWASTARQVHAVEDAALVDTLGVRVPDPRPAFERAELRMRAFGWAVVTGGAAVIALMALAMYGLVHPTPLPPDLKALEAELEDPRPPT